jgi:cytidyltransferase-like protein
MINNKTIGVIHGRFQPFHLGHLDYVMQAKENCDFLYIGIANPDPSLTKPHETNQKRAEKASNPFTYYERLAMIKKTVLNEGIKETEFEIIPFPINYPEYIKYYAPTDATFFITIYDSWGYSKKETLEKQNLRISILQEGEPSLKLAEGTKIRELMLNNQNWEQFVPLKVGEYIKENKLISKRIFNLI